MTEARDQLQKLTECCICFKIFTDPRILQCIHTFCLECLKQTGEATKKESGENMPCPLCRKLFVIPAEGMNGLQKNFFMQHLIDVTAMIQLGQKKVIDCDMCKALHEGDEEKTKEATMRCLECTDNFCDICSKAHRLLKLSKTHNIVKIGNETEEDIRNMKPIRNCANHNGKPLDFYCADCKTILCVSCFVENHASHNCKDVNTVHKEFRQTVEKDVIKISKCVEEILSKGRMVEQRKAEVLLNLSETEDKIIQRNLELKEIIDSHTNSLLEELSHMKQKQIKEFANEIEEIDRISLILKSFETYCTELISKGSASDVCNCVDELITRTNELEKDHETFIGLPFPMTEVSFKDTGLRGLLSNPSNNIVGQIECKLIGCAVWSPQHPSPSSDNEPDQRQSDNVMIDAADETKTGKTTNENCEITFLEALAKYMEMLEKIRDQVIPIKVRTKDIQPSLLEEEEADKLDRQFQYVISIRPDKGETEQWTSIEQDHDKLVELACTAANGFTFNLMLAEVNFNIESMLYNLDAMR